MTLTRRTALAGAAGLPLARPALALGPATFTITRQPSIIYMPSHITGGSASCIQQRERDDIIDDDRAFATVMFRESDAPRKGPTDGRSLLLSDLSNRVQSVTPVSR